MPLGSVRVARYAHGMGLTGSPDGPVHNLTHVTGPCPCTQIAPSPPQNGL